jgi:hypothetical protein
MINYSFVGYNVVEDKIYFKGVPIPGTRELLGGDNLSTSETSDILFNYKDQESELVDSTVVTFLKDLLTDFSITATKLVDFRIEIQDSNSIRNISITAINLDETRSYVNTGVVEADLSIIDSILPFPKWKTMGKCRNCLAVNWLSGSNDYNLEGTIGGEYSGLFFNNQKTYKFNLIDYTNLSLPTNIPYVIFWRPNLTTSFTDYAGNSRVISNKHKWIAVPESEYPNGDIYGTGSFFHEQSQFDAACPYSTNSLIWYNFFGQKGFFRLSVAATSGDYLKPCPTYSPSPAGGWGFDCDGEGNCLGANSGSVGAYSTLAECEASCSNDPTGSFGFNCSINGCVQGTALNPGVYNTLAECEASGCGDSIINPPTSCPTCTDNIITNGDFLNNLDDWILTPTQPTPGIGGWYNGGGFAGASIQNIAFTGSSPNLSSEVFIQQSIPTITEKCEYNICLQIWAPIGEAEAIIDIAGNQFWTGPLLSTPTAFNFSFIAGNTNDLSVFFAGDGRIAMDNVCLELINCPPGIGPDCIITGSADCYTDIEYDCLCPEGFIPDGTTGNCIESGSILVPKIITGSAVISNIVGANAWGPFKPTLYSEYNISSVSPIDTQTSFTNNSRVYNTQFAFDILSASFWNEDILTGQGGVGVWTSNGFSDQFTRNIPSNGNYYGGGNFINLTSSGTYHVAVLADDSYRVKINGATIVEVEPSTWAGFNTQQSNARHRDTNPSASTWGGIQNLGSGFGNTYGYRSFSLYPVTMSTGCNELIIEGADVNGSLSGFAGLVFANTAQEIVAANNIDDLNIIFNTRDNLIWNLSAGDISGSCPEGTTPVGPSNCDLCVATGSAVPCGNCLECVHGILYNGYVLDQGSPALLGRGTGGIINTAISGTWALPNENDFDTLITYLNNSIASTSTNGALDVISGGKMKDYTRDLIASCWAFPNVGAQTDANSSKWAGDASGERTSVGDFDGLGFFGKWWIANSITPSNTQMKSIELKHFSDDVFKSTDFKNNGYSLRLVRPATTGENNGDYLTDIYTGNNGLIYDGIVIGNQVWINKNLSETQYNNSGPIAEMQNPGVWNLATVQSRDYRCYYNNDSNLTSSLAGNVDPNTGLCYEYPVFYVYQGCNNNNILVQTESGSSTTLGDIQKSPIDGNCYSLLEIRTDNPDLSANIFYEGNYFSGSSYIYSDCEECEAIHTIYMNFETKNC